MNLPIADPFGSPPVATEERRVFRQSFWRVYVWSLLLVALFVVPTVGILLWIAIPEMFSGIGRLFVAGMFSAQILFCPLVGVLSVFLYSVKITRFGIQGPLSMGLIEWEQMQSVRFAWRGSLWARVSIRNRFFEMWIPLFLTDWNGFVRTLQEWAPEDNPLRVCAQKRGF